LTCCKLPQNLIFLQGPPFGLRRTGSPNTYEYTRSFSDLDSSSAKNKLFISGFLYELFLTSSGFPFFWTLKTYIYKLDLYVFSVKFIYSFITPTLLYTSYLWLSLYRFIINSKKYTWYRTDYNNRPSSAVSFMPPIPSTSVRLHSEFVRLLFLQTHRETDRFFESSGVQSGQSTSVSSTSVARLSLTSSREKLA
jgi:hypothetical protein